MFKITDILAKAQQGGALTVEEHYLLVHQMLDEIIQSGHNLISKALSAKVSLDVDHDDASEHPNPGYRMTQHEARLLGVRCELEDLKSGAVTTLKERIKQLEAVVALKYVPDEPEPDRKRIGVKKRAKSKSAS